jgi:hypothetical protein
VNRSFHSFNTPENIRADRELREAMEEIRAEHRQKLLENALLFGTADPEPDATSSES